MKQNETSFDCMDCGGHFPVQTSGPTGYAVDKEGRKICYQCMGKRDKADMLATGKACLYLTMEREQGGTRNAKVSNWPGTLSFWVGMRIGRHNIAGKRYDVWFMCGGQNWHGVTYGDHTQICHCKRTKVA